MLCITTVTRPLSAGSMTMFSSVFSRFSACRSSLVKLLSGREADCIVEAILLLMLSLADSESSLWRDRTASTLDTMASVGIRLGVTEWLIGRVVCRYVSVFCKLSSVVDTLDLFSSLAYLSCAACSVWLTSWSLNLSRFPIMLGNTVYGLEEV